MGACLNAMVEAGASDLFLSVGAPPTLKIGGAISSLALPPLSSADAKTLAYSIMRESQIREFESTLECDLAMTIEGLGRFRFNVYMQRGEVGLVGRYISGQIPTLEHLKLPAVLRELAMLKRGLVLITGAAGSGKSTTLASMLDFRNASSNARKGTFAYFAEPLQPVI